MSIPETYIEDCCPNCDEIIQFTQEQLDDSDGYCLILNCPGCGKLVCPPHSYVYTGGAGECI